MSGHLFITHGNLLHLACDHWALPTDAAGRVEPWWDPSPVARRTAAEADLRRNRVVAVPPRRGEPQPWLVVAGAWDQKPSWYATGAERFVTAAAAAGPRSPYRSRPLLALPLLGTGAGGARTFRGDVIEALVTKLVRCAKRFDADVVLVCKDARSFAAAQRARRRLKNSPWHELPEELRTQADDLAARARAGELVLFLGAGISMGAGLPSWSSLISKLARQAGIVGAQRRALKRVPSPLDQARLIELRLAEGKEGLGTQVGKLLSKERYGLAHSMLASLPVGEVVTTNYDVLFERASDDAEQPLAVLPYASVEAARRWLLKLHGSVDRPDDIVLTRDHYLGFSERRAALAGIVQAMLLTRHMLFAGFSLSDDNFHRIAYDVRTAIRAGDGDVHPFGTALTLVDQPMLTELWRSDLETIAVASTDTPIAEAARTQEIFFDRLLASATTATSYVLDDDFDGLLDPDEQALKAAMRKLQQSIVPEQLASSAWSPVRALLESLGASE